jgi:hypothetical protein
MQTGLLAALFQSSEVSISKNQVFKRSVKKTNLKHKESEETERDRVELAASGANGGVGIAGRGGETLFTSSWVVQYVPELM